MFDFQNNKKELLKVERPGRYLGGEIGSGYNKTPDSQGHLLNVALCFPDVYEIAHSHLGHKILYSLINERPGLSAQRVYAPWPDWEEILFNKNIALASLEEGRPLADFDLVGFSLQYELGYTTILNMLALGKIPLWAHERDDSFPLICAGGPGAYNPEPLADFFDIFFLGDAEASFADDLEIIKEWKAEKAPKDVLFQRLAGRPGIYIPSFFTPHYNANGRFTGLEAKVAGYEKVERAVVASLEKSLFPLCQITPFLKPVHDRVVLEIGRGCSRGCRFCQAGYIYRPVRERSHKTIMSLADANLKATGQDEVSFLSLSAGDHSQIAQMVSGFMDEYAAQTVALSLPSLRVKSMKGQLARQIKRVRKTGFTLAPEAGSQRLRDIINKDVTEEDLFSAAEIAFSLGWRTLKLYFMVGLPGEEVSDIEAIGELARKIKKMSRAQLNLGVAHFTPKAHTPFQWHPGSSVEAIKERLLVVRDKAKVPGLTPKWNEPGASFVESIIARGDRRLAKVLALVYKKGARLEAWSDHFNLDIWTEAIAESGLSLENLLTPFAPGDPLPYAHLGAGATEEFLLRELKLSQAGKTSADCRFASCLKCGACGPEVKIDLAQKEPEVFADDALEETEAPASTASSPAGLTYLINFKKTGRLSFLGHLELVEVFKRAFRRAQISLAQTEGFHPGPKISFLTALPLGVSSEDEYLKAVLLDDLDPAKLKELLALELPPELALKEARKLKAGENKLRPQAVSWRLSSLTPVFKTAEPLYPEAELSYTVKKGIVKTFSLKEFVLSAQAHDEKTLTIEIRLGLNGTPKPILAAAALWGLEPENLQLELYKLETRLTCLQN